MVFVGAPVNLLGTKVPVVARLPPEDLGGGSVSETHGWFELTTVRRRIWGNDHLSCGFGLQWSYLALKWKSGQGKVEFRLGATTGTFHVNFNSTHINFIASYGSVTIFFCQASISVKIIILHTTVDRPLRYTSYYETLVCCHCEGRSCQKLKYIASIMHTFRGL